MGEKKSMKFKLIDRQKKYYLIYSKKKSGKLVNKMSLSPTKFMVLCKFDGQMIKNETLETTEENNNIIMNVIKEVRLIEWPSLKSALIQSLRVMIIIVIASIFTIITDFILNYLSAQMLN